MSSRTERIGDNEALFREINERISRIQEEFGQKRSFEIVAQVHGGMTAAGPGHS